MTYAEAVLILAALRDQTAGPAEAEKAFLRFCLENITRSSGQFLQDLWVAHELGSQRDGFFVEFGAADGIRFSNSLFLEKALGWTGILAEPGRGWYPALRQNRTCAVDERCVWTQTGRTVTFNQPRIAEHGAIEQFSGADMHAATRVRGQRYEVETVSLADLLDHWKAPRRIDYLSVDTEGSEFDILSAFDFDAWDVRLITVEHNHTTQRGAIFRLLSEKGYRRRFEKLSNVDDWYVKVS